MVPKLNTKIFTLDNVLMSYDYGMLTQIYSELCGVRDNMLDEQICLIEELNDEFIEDWAMVDEYNSTIDFIDEQLGYIDNNIRVFRDAMVVKETQLISTQLVGDVNVKICLN